MPTIRNSPEDFLVEEIPLREIFAGERSDASEILGVRIEKRGWTSEEVASALAEVVGVPNEHVGFAGRKDRHASTRQWFSVPACPEDELAGVEQRDLEILEVTPLQRKLRLGDLEANRFSIVVRDVAPGVIPRAEAEWQRMLEHGMPNRFGLQRFGSLGDNAERGARVVSGDLKIRNRRLERLMVSAFQSRVFNQVLATRQLPLSVVREGDLSWVHKRAVAILVLDAAEDQPRADRFEISPTGPLFGERMRLPRGAPLREEEAVLEEFGLPPFRQLRLPRRLRLPGARRPLRVRIDEGALLQRDGRLELEFVLPPGSYATTLLEELFEQGTLLDAARPDPAPGSESVDGVG